MIPTLRLLLPLLGFVCVASVGSSAENLAENSPEEARPVLSVGMDAEQIRALVGSPSKIRKVERDGAVGEIWIYSYRTQTGVQAATVGTQEVPYFDLVSNSVKMRQESVMGEERLYTVETTELLMVEGKLAAAKRYRRIERSYD